MSKDKKESGEMTVDICSEGEEQEQLPPPITQEELNALLGEHSKWLDNKDRHGTQADLSGKNLYGANLEKKDLRLAILKNVSNLHTANLHDCNFEGATGLTGMEFARADITGAKLPEGIRDFKMLAIVEETSQNAIKIFIATVLSCIYSWLTIGSTSDVSLLTNSSATPLPIIQTAIPIATFYLIAPFLLIALYFYLHFYLQRLWTALGTLPAIFEDGRPLDQRAYPWPANGLVRRHFEKLRYGRLIILRFEEYAIIILAWGLVPFTLGWFWLRYIPCRNWLGTDIHLTLIIISIAAGVYSYHLHVQTLRGTRPDRFRLRIAWRDRRVYQSAGVIIVAAIAVGLSLNSINVNKWNQFIVLDRLGFNVFADFREKDISIRPDNYWLIEPAYHDSSVSGARLAGADLRYADARKAFLLYADLRASILFGANLDDAQLQLARLDTAIIYGASLNNASLQGANLTRTNLHGAELRYAHLDSAILIHSLLKVATLIGSSLRGARLDSAILDSAILDSACLIEASLQAARLFGARLRACDLVGATLDAANLDSVYLDSAFLVSASLRGAHLSGAILRRADIRNANLDSASLEGAILRGANLKEATLRGCDLQYANLDSADISNADLSTALNLTQKQLDAACGDSLTKLPPGLHIKPCPKEEE
jgi:uncharacterized protein YjbI with pentapeptide repeats